MKRILFVDDEAKVLSGLRRSLYQQRSEWDMTFVESGHAALETLGEQPDFDVIVSDIRMPNMTGEQLLEQVANRFPKLSRLILSGHADRAASIRAAGVAHQFLAKPCDPDSLKRAVERSCTLRATLNDPDLLQTVAGIGQLPSLPRIYRAVSDEVNSDDPSLDKVAALIEEDLGMSAKILQLVNSAYFGIGRRVESVRHAATLLGLDVIQDLVLANSAFAEFGDAAGADWIEREWRHGLRTGSVTRLLATDFDLSKAEVGELTAAGNLHDIGKVVLKAHMPQRYANVEARIAEGTPELEAEREEFGCSHGAISGTLLGLWGLADTVVEAVTYHHVIDPAGTERTAHTVLVSVANELANALDDNSDCDDVQATLAASPYVDRIADWYARVSERLTNEE